MTVPDPRETPTMDVREFGKLLGLGRDASYVAAHNGQFPVLRFGRKLRVPTAEGLKMLGLYDGGDAA